MTEYFNRKRTDPIPEVNGTILPEYFLGDAKLTMWIPADLAGKVIGKKGTVITHIQRETKARLINALPVVGDSLWMPVAIVGEWASITLAYKAISDMVFGEVDDVVFEFMINYRRPFFLYGRYKYDAVKYISAMSNVRILLPEFDPKEQKFSEATPVTLEGSFDNVTKAIALFEQEALHYVERQKEKRRVQAEKGPETIEEKEKPKPKLIAKVVEIERRPLERPRPPAIAASTESSAKPVAPSSSSSIAATVNAAKVADKRERDSKRPEIVVRKMPPAAVPPAQIAGEKKEPPVVVVEPPKVLITRSIEVPGNVVGLLLTKRSIGTMRVSTMGIIQRNSRTSISKSKNQPAPKATIESSSTVATEKVGDGAMEEDTGKEGVEVIEVENDDEEEIVQKDTKDRRRRRRAADEDNEEEGGDASESEDGEEDEDSDEEDDSEAENNNDEDVMVEELVAENGEEDSAIDKAENEVEDINAPKEAAAEKSEPSAAVTTKPERVKKVYSQDPVLFDITGYEQAHVDLAYDTLVLIFKGERIRDVIAAMTKLPPLKFRPGKEWKEKPARSTTKPREKLTKREPRDPTAGKKERPERPVRGKKGGPSAAVDDSGKASSKSESWLRSLPLPDDKNSISAEEPILIAPAGERDTRGRGGRGRGRGRSSAGRGSGRTGSKPAAVTSTSTE